MLTLQQTTRMYLDSKIKVNKILNIRTTNLKTKSYKQNNKLEKNWNFILKRQERIYKIWTNDHITNQDEFKLQLKLLYFQCDQYENLSN